MRRVLREPGAEVIVGLLSFAVSFFAIGLSFIALDTNTIRALAAIVSFMIGGLLFIFALMVAALLFNHIRTLNQCQTVISSYMRQAYKLRMQVLKEWGPELAESTNQWVHEVQEWLDDNLPELAPDFGLETIRGTNEAIYYGGIEKPASEAALLIESRVSNLRDILREIRA